MPWIEQRNFRICMHGLFRRPCLILLQRCERPFFTLTIVVIRLREFNAWWVNLYLPVFSEMDATLRFTAPTAVAVELTWWLRPNTWTWVCVNQRIELINSFRESAYARPRGGSNSSAYYGFSPLGSALLCSAGHDGGHSSFVGHFSRALPSFHGTLLPIIIHSPALGRDAQRAPCASCIVIVL